MSDSTNIETHLKDYRNDMLNNQTVTKKYELEQDIREKMNKLKKESEKKLQDHRIAIQEQNDRKLDEARDAEHKKQQSDFSKLQDKKEDIRNDYE
jgi:hypothetical protein